MCGERASPNICPGSGRPAGAGSTVSDRLSLVTVRPGIRKQNGHARTSSRDPEGLPTSGNDQSASRDERRQPQVGTASSPQAGTSTTSCDDLGFAGGQTTATTAAVLFRPRRWTDGVRPFHGAQPRSVSMWRIEPTSGSTPFRHAHGRPVNPGVGQRRPVKSPTMLSPVGGWPRLTPERTLQLW